jgi:hypothetical protein
VPPGGFILILSGECISWLAPEDRYKYIIAPQYKTLLECKYWKIEGIIWG